MTTLSPTVRRYVGLFSDFAQRVRIPPPPLEGEGRTAEGSPGWGLKRCHPSRPANICRRVADLGHSEQ
jgi:hypothetical protein